jgi:hypothetical protein
VIQESSARTQSDITCGHARASRFNASVWPPVTNSTAKVSYIRGWYFKRRRSFSNPEIRVARSPLAIATIASPRKIISATAARSSAGVDQLKRPRNMKTIAARAICSPVVSSVLIQIAVVRLKWLQYLAADSEH